MHKGRLGELHRYIHVCSQIGTYTETCLLSNGHTEKFYDWI